MTDRPSLSVACAVAATLMVVGASPLAGAGLTSGDVDDNLNFQHFLGYAGAVAQTNWDLPRLDLADRVTLRITTAEGAPVPLARAEFRDAAKAGSPVAVAHAGTDGVLQLFPTHDLGASGGTLVVEIFLPGGTESVYRGEIAAGPAARWRDLVLDISPTRGAPAALDIMLVLDTTGSMEDEFEYLAQELGSIVGQARGLHPQVDMRFSLVVYRDHYDDYVVRSYPFTESLDTFEAALANQSASGGGDLPEAVEEAVEEALDQGWRDGNTARLMWLVADAAPHAEGYQRLIDAFGDARAQGIRVYPIAGSSGSPQAEYLFRAGALLTGGRYAFLTDDSGLGGAHGEPTVACYQVTELRDLMSRVVAGELAGQRVEADPVSVVRTVGSIDRGVCVDPEEHAEEPAAEEPRGPSIPASVLPPGSVEGGADAGAEPAAPAPETGTVVYAEGSAPAGSGDVADTGGAAPPPAVPLAPPPAPPGDPALLSGAGDGRLGASTLTTTLSSADDPHRAGDGPLQVAGAGVSAAPAVLVAPGWLLIVAMIAVVGAVVAVEVAKSRAAPP